jgi:P4 family phage/plasmid primase-like protien
MSTSGTTQAGGNDNIATSFDHIKHVERYGATYFMVKRKCEKGEMGPQQYMLEEMAFHGKKLAITYQPKEKDRWFASYPSINDFIKRYQKVSSKTKQFYEILSGAVHTYADLDWEQEEPNDLEVTKAFEDLFWTVASEQLDIPKGDGRIIWSTSSSEGRGSLHFKHGHVDKCWRNTAEQKRFWEAVMVHLIANKEQYSALFVNGKCIIDMAVYTKNRAWRLLYSHKCKSDRNLVPFGDGRHAWRDYFITVEEPFEYFKLASPAVVKKKKEEALLALNDEPPSPIVYEDDLEYEQEQLEEHFEEPVEEPKEHVQAVPDVLVAFDHLLAKKEWTEEFIRELIEEKVPNTEFVRMKEPNVAILKTVGERKCIIGGEINTSDNCYLVLAGRDVLFKCHDAGCKGKSKKIYSFEIEEVAYDADNDLFRADEGLSDIFVNFERENLRVVDSKGSCYLWSDRSKLWESHHKGWISNRISTTLEKVIRHAMEEETDEEELKQLRSLCKYVLSSSGSRAIMQKVLPKLEDLKFAETLNSDPDVLPLRDGKILLLSTGEIRQRTREDLFSFECPVLPTKNSAQLKRVDKFMLSIANDNEELKIFLQKQLGYFMTGHTSERCFFIWWGVGANGKGTICNLMKHILNRFYVAASKDVFVKGGQHKSGSATPQLVPLIGARMAVFAESSKEETLNAEQIKSLSGNDTISYRPMYGEQSSFTPICKLIMQTNHKPKFDVGDDAVMDRIRFNPFLSRFVVKPTRPNEQFRDVTLVRELETILLDAVFTWILQGAIAWYEGGLGEAPELVRAETNAYVSEVDDVGRFIEDCCTLGAGLNVCASELYQAYEAWALQLGERYKGKREFGQRMVQLHEKKRTKKGFSYTGLQITIPEHVAEQAEDFMNVEE